mgnify:CR=1 FL=1
MLILKSFFRRKTTKNYIIIFTSIYFIMFILLLFKCYYIRLNNAANKNSYVYIDNEQDFEILKHFKDVDNIEDGCLVNADNQEYIFIKDDSLKNNEDLNVNDTLDFNYGKYLNLFVVKNKQEDKYNFRFYSVNSEQFNKILGEENSSLIKIFTLKNWLKSNSLLKNMNKEMIGNTVIFNSRASMANFEGIINLLNVFIVLCIIVFIILLFLSIFNIYMNDKKNNFMYEVVGISKMKVLGYFILKIANLQLATGIVSLGIAIIGYKVILLLIK